MKHFVINTDAKTPGMSPHDFWFENGPAMTAGPQKYGEVFRLIAKGDRALMYLNREGVMGTGQGTAAWDGVAHEPLVYETRKDPVYCISVDWLWDLRADPMRWEDLRALGFHLIPRAMFEVKPETGSEAYAYAAGRASSGEEGESLQADARECMSSEGRMFQVTANVYERNPNARRACIRHYGTGYLECGFSFGDKFGVRRAASDSDAPVNRRLRPNLECT